MSHASLMRRNTVGPLYNRGSSLNQDILMNEGKQSVMLGEYTVRTFFMLSIHTFQVNCSQCFTAYKAFTGKIMISCDRIIMMLYDVYNELFDNCKDRPVVMVVLLTRGKCLFLFRRYNMQQIETPDR